MPQKSTGIRKTPKAKHRLAYSLNRFKHSGKSFVALKDGKIFYESRERNLIPIVNYINHFGWYNKNLILYDKYIGYAAALLISKLHPMLTITPILTIGALRYFKKKKIKFQAEKSVPHLMGLASRGTCKWEKLAYGKSATILWKLVKKRVLRYHRVDLKSRYPVF